MSRPLWGKARAGPDKPKRVAAVLWAAALDVGMDRDEVLWAEVVHDIITLTGVSDSGARLQFELLRDRNLTRPLQEPTWWRD